MAENDIDEQIERNPDLQKSLEKSGVSTRKKKTKREPIYKIINHDAKIAVSRHQGKIWKSRCDRSLSKRKKKYENNWNEAIRYYNADQSSHRDSDGMDQAQNDTVRFGSKRHNSHTENIVFANTSALVPMIYAKNPVVEVTESLPENEDYVSEVAEPFMNNIVKRRAFPRLQLKSVSRRSVVCTTLTNVAYVEVGYTKKAEASEEALIQLQELSDQLANAKSAKEVEKIEGQIYAIEERINFLRPEGPWLKCLSPFQVVRDCSNTDEDLTDDNWIMICDYMPTNYLQAVYGTDQNGSTRMLFQPTHVLPAEKNNGGNATGRNTAEIEVDAYELLNDTSKGGDYGYDDEGTYKDAQMTKVWKVWDKTTRRLYLYADNDWEWPVWVWNDPYNLVDFYPIAQLTFYTAPIEGIGGSEVSYYLDQQDAINEKHSQFAEARNQARFNLAYDKNKVIAQDVEDILTGDKPRALGVDVPEGMKIEEIISAIMPPAIKYLDLFDPTIDHQAIHRISSVSASMQGQEFRTNTTNKAIEYYNSTQATRLDEKIDAIEDFIATILWMVYQMCVQFMSEDLVTQIIGKTRASKWVQMSAKELQARIGGMEVVGGSTQKPNTEAKKQMAIEAGQVLGQFASATPTVVVQMLKMFERAFDEVVINKEEWAQIREGIAQQLTQGQPSQQQSGQPQQQQSAGGADIQQILSQLPPQAQQAVAQAIQQGVPPEVAIQRVIEMAQQSQPTQ